MGEPFTMRTFAPPPIRLMWAGVEHLLDGDPDIGDILEARRLLAALDSGDETAEVEARRLAGELLSVYSPNVTDVEFALARHVLFTVSRDGLARGRRAAQAAYTVTRHVPPPAALVGQDGAPGPVITTGTARPREPQPQRHLKVAGVRDGPGSDDPPLLDPALVEQVRRQMRGVPSLTFSVDFEGHAQLRPDCLNEGEEQRLRVYVADHASGISAAFLDLLETWLAR